MKSEDDEKSKKDALKILLDYDEVCDADSNFRASEGQNRTFENPSFVSFIRGTNYDDKLNVSSTGFNTQRRLFSEAQSLDNMNISDSDFFDTETGRAQILKDQVSHERFVQKTNCSSWTLFSQRNISSIAMANVNQKTSVSVGEFIGVFSEPISFSDTQKKPDIFANCLTSTPKGRRKSRSVSSLLDVERKEMRKACLCMDTPTSSIKPLKYSTPNWSENSLHSETSKTLTTSDCESCRLSISKSEESLSIGTPTSVRPLKFSTPNWAENNSHSNDFNYFIGSTARKNIQRLRKEEQLRSLDKTITDSQENDRTVLNVSGATGFGSGTTLVLRGGTFASTIRNEEWFVEPESILLDRYKGKQVLITNSTTKILKFKTSFNSRMISVSPLSGTIRAMEKVGLRIMLGAYAKKQNENFEEEIKIIIGKTEKKIHVKFVKEQKTKCTRERSYICF